MKNRIGKIAKYIFNKRYRLGVRLNLGKYDHLADEEFLRLRYFAVYGRELNLDAPELYSEKVQWLKLYDRKPEYTVMSDKYLARDYVAQRIGEEHLIPLLGVWDDPAEIDFDQLPDSFVLKCNHNSGKGMYICKDKALMDKAKVVRELKEGLAEDYYAHCREWVYKDVPRKIIAEKYMEDKPGADEFTDYKIFCFDGEPHCVMACIDRQKGRTKKVFFDSDWSSLGYNGYSRDESVVARIERPEKLDEMLEIARKLSEGFPFIRVDLYSTEDEVYFGELTFYHYAGFDTEIDEQSDRVLGGLLRLPVSKEQAE